MLKKLIPIFTIFIFLNNASIADVQAVEYFIDEVAARIIKTVTNKNISSTTKSSQLCNLIDNEFDIKWMSRFALGKNYRKLSDYQRSSYTKLYANYLCNNYSPILMKYSDESYKINKVIKTGKKDYDANVVIFRKGGAPPIKLTYHVKEVGTENDSSAYKSVDMIVEGVSTILSQRSEFSSKVQRDGIDGLLEELRGIK